MAHQLRIGYKEEERRQRAKEVGEERKGRKRGEGKEGRGGRGVTDYMWPIMPKIFTLLNENICQFLDYRLKSLQLKSFFLF